jgi:hypothetical protein
LLSQIYISGFVEYIGTFIHQKMVDDSSLLFNEVSVLILYSIYLCDILEEKPQYANIYWLYRIITAEMGHISVLAHPFWVVLYSMIGPNKVDKSYPSIEYSEIKGVII